MLGKSALPVAILAVAASLTSPAYASTQAARYVAIGDSYVAGALTGLPTGTPVGCARTTGNYPHLIAPVVAPNGLVDVSCSSAETKHVFEAQPQPGGLGTAPPQLDAVNAATTLVTIGLGGNDIKILDLVSSCVSPIPYGTPCKDKLTAGGVDEMARRIAATGPKVAQVLTAVRAKAPTARVLVVGYPSVIPDSGRGCWPVVPFTDGDTAYLRDTLKRLNLMLADQARAAGATYVDTYTPSIGRDYCQLPGVKWIEPLLPTEPATPFHPNARGECGMADAVLATLARPIP